MRRSKHTECYLALQMLEPNRLKSWVCNNWKPTRQQTIASIWEARDEMVKGIWRAVAEESLLDERLIEKP